eukprot:gnl/TRDRNA2_/TRDRNA2_169350_c5_seq6.p1 gnl/TRDRNA2_/TRDRNA2_169350_c5~~gnl/TRDRNA2_/TRDRNA2_169350_c5_seq6.p1  ORF type:complete len:152 (+),score=27.03 gnl/TRDRNA2_/TRDRNA2_169350_c5_seq6:128-583(+)
MQICVTTLTGKTITLDIEASDTIGRVKFLIHEREGIKPGQQKLIFDSNHLQSGHKLSEYGIQEGCMLALVVVKVGDMPICVELFGGKTVALNISSDATIEDVKESITEELGIPMQQQRLFFGGNMLGDDRKTVSYYNITRKTKLWLVLVLR